MSGPAFGTNKGTAADFVAAGITPYAAYRGYNYVSTGIPTTWPGTSAAPIPAGVTVPVISVNPQDIESTGPASVNAITAGTFDTQIAAWFALVPAGAMVTFFEEGEAPSNWTTPPTAAELIACHAHLYSLFRANAPAGALYGQIFSSYTANTRSAHYPMKNWVSCTANGGTDLDFYGIDGYQGSVSDGTETIAEVFTASATQIHSVYPLAVLAVTEVNSSTQASRPSWFSQAYAWAQDNGCLTYMTWFGTGYTWNASDSATITELLTINEQSRAGGPYLIGTSAGSPASSTVTLTAGVSTGTGDAIVVAASINSLAQTVASVADSQSNVYGPAVTSAVEYDAALFIATAGPGGTGPTVALAAGTDTITVTVSSATATAKNVIAAGFPGVLTASAADRAVSSSSAGSATPSVGTGVLTSASEVIVAFESNGSGGGSIAWAAGWTPIAGGLETASNQISGMAAQTVTSAASVTAQGSITSAKWNILAASLFLAPPDPDPLLIPPALPQFPAGYGPLPADFASWVTSTLGFQTTGVVFRAEAQDQQTFALSGGIKNAVISYDTVLEDPYNGWNSAANAWTAPYTGIYQVTVFCSVATFACNLQAEVLLSGVTAFTTTGAELSSAVVGGGSATALVVMTGGLDYIQGYVTVQAASGSPHTDVSAPGRLPTLEIAFLSQ